jgi:hypothetical protein
MTEFLTAYSFLSLLNIILSIFLLSGAGLIVAVMKYHLGAMKSVEIDQMKRGKSR